MRTCIVDGCTEKHDARGYCRNHYKRFMRHGDPLTVKQASPGSGWIDKKGHRCHTVDGHAKPDHVIVAEKALGHPMPAGAQVHHMDENPLNNDPSNLVICPSAGYHQMLHARMRAFKATGNADWKKCPFCHKYDDPVNMEKEKVRFVHKVCRNLSRNAIRKEGTQKHVIYP